jgi:steroid delta-isomerase-like uncharacterized protein
MPDANKRLLIRHFSEVLNEGRLAVIDEIYADGYVLDAPVQTDGSLEAHGETRGREALKRRVSAFRTAFPDLAFTIGDIVGEDDRVAVQYTFTGTHDGRFGDLEPTGRAISVGGMLLAEVADGRIQRAYSVFDSGDMLHQLVPQDKDAVHRFIDAVIGRIHQVGIR